MVLYETEPVGLYIFTHTRAHTHAHTHTLIYYKVLAYVITEFHWASHKIRRLNWLAGDPEELGCSSSLSLKA